MFVPATQLKIQLALMTTRRNYYGFISYTDTDVIPTNMVPADCPIKSSSEN